MDSSILAAIATVVSGLICAVAAYVASTPSARKTRELIDIYEKAVLLGLGVENLVFVRAIIEERIARIAVPSRYRILAVLAIASIAGCAIGIYLWSISESLAWCIAMPVAANLCVYAYYSAQIAKREDQLAARMEENESARAVDHGGREEEYEDGMSDFAHREIVP